MNLDTFPDDELLLVLGFMRTRELLRCRGVCRRLRDMALHPHLWRKRSVSSYDGVPLCATVLRLVPCLGSLSLSSLYKDVPEYLRLGPLFVTTNCAISKLELDIAPQTAVFLAMALTRQAALGRLTSVSLALETTNNTPGLRLLLDQVLHTPGLTSLAMSSDINEAVPLELTLPEAAKEDVVPASLRRLDWDFTDTTLPVYLKWHADTLEEVELELSEIPAGTAALLGSLPRLQKLKCSIMDDMPALLQCPALKTLDLSVDVKDATRPYLPGVHKFLSRAAHRLETLTLQFVEEDDPTKTKVCAGAVNLLLSLAGPGSSAPSALRSLSLTYMECDDAWEPQPQLLPLASVLHRLENLVTLNLGGPHTPHFFEAMDGRVLPRLEWLRIYIRDYTTPGCCPHEWAHGAEPRDLLRRYPRLHLEVDPRHEHGACEDCDYEGCDECKCDYCAKNLCHDFHCIVHTLFTHPEHEVCNQKHVEVGVRIEL